MTLATMVMSNLVRQPVRSLLTVLGVAVGVAAGFAMASVAWGFESSWVRVYKARGTDMVVARMTSRSPLPTAFDEARVAEVATVRGVRSAAGVITDLLKVEDGPTLPVHGFQPGSFLWNSLTWREGSLQKEPSGGVYLGVLAAEALRKKKGDLLTIEDRKLPVLGVYESSAVAENGSIFMALPTMQSLLGMEGKVNFLNLQLDQEAGDFATVKETIEHRFRGLKVFRTGEVAEKNTGVLAAKAMSLATSLIALVVGTIGIVNTLMISVFERTREFGLLMAIGWRRSRIASMVLWESVFLSLTGAALGIAAGYTGVRCLENMNMMKGKIEGEFSGGLVATAFAIALCLGIAGGILPALRACSMQPRSALRTE
jgi:putative ABC transport system permease protein